MQQLRSADHGQRRIFAIWMFASSKLTIHSHMDVPCEQETSLDRNDDGGVKTVEGDCYRSIFFIGGKCME